MNRSDLIITLAAQHPQLNAKDIEVSVKVIFDAMSNALAKMAVLKFVVSAFFVLITDHLVMDAIPRAEYLFGFLQNMCHISRPGKNCVSGCAVSCIASKLGTFATN